MRKPDLEGSWALILGASSGFGEANALKLSSLGMNIIGVHLDRKATLPNVERIREQIKNNGAESLYFNVNAAGHEERESVLDQIEEHLGENAKSSVRILLHSLAFGTLKPYIADEEKDAITPRQLEMTLDVMANSLVYWTQALVRRDLMGSGGRIYAMTSAGGHRIWKTYGAVSAAKAALESHIRQLAVELAPIGITANSIQAGVTDTPALRKIPRQRRDDRKHEKNQSPRGTDDDAESSRRHRHAGHLRHTVDDGRFDSGRRWRGHRGLRRVSQDHGTIPREKCPGAR